MSVEHGQRLNKWYARSTMEGGFSRTTPVGDADNEYKGHHTLMIRIIKPGMLMGNETCEHTGQPQNGRPVKTCIGKPVIVYHFIHWDKSEELRALCADHIPESMRNEISIPHI